MVEFIGSSRKDLRAMPKEVRYVFGYAILLAEIGSKHPHAKPMKGFGGAGLLEVVDDFQGDTYRAIYTLRFAGVVYVLHAFQKKSKRGAQTPKQDIDLIKERLKQARQHYEENFASPT